MILLDTQVFVWLMEDNQRLGRHARDKIQADPDRRVSSMVSWEIAMLVRKDRFRLQMPLDRWMAESLSSIDAREIPVTGDIARDAGELDDTVHGDPCDRIMIATARSLGCALITADRKILDYAASGHVRAIDARR